MSLLDLNTQLGQAVASAAGKPGATGTDKKAVDKFWQNGQASDYQPTQDEMLIRQMIIHHFTLGDITMQKPRVEFNDLSVINRTMVDQMAFNTYQPNNGDASMADPVNAWRSRALKPVVRNKVISIAAHATARLIFPKVFAQDESANEQQEAAQVMEDLMEYAADESNYEMTSLDSVLTALTDPASITYTEYAEVYRNVKREKGEDGKYRQELIKDPVLCGFKDWPVPVDQLYIENFYEPDIQKQGFLIWRRVISHTLAESKYGDLSKYPNFKYVRAGVQLIYNDANQSFYGLYDTNMRQEDDEEIIYWNRNLDLKIIMVNGVMLTTCDNPNPRNDKLYPFSKYGYEKINNRCFYYKSLAFKMQQDANIVNSLYPLVIDGTYLRVMPPMVNSSETMIKTPVIIPGAVTTISDPSATITPIQTATDQGLQTAMKTLEMIEESLSEDDPTKLAPGGQDQPGNQTAYEISRMEQNAATVLGLFIKMRADFIRQYGRLRMGDILQYLTIADAEKIEGASESKLVYQTFLLQNKHSAGRTKTRRIEFDSELPDEPQTPAKKLNHSYKILKEQGGIDSKQELYRVNPRLFRDLDFTCVLSPDVLNPHSEDLERAFMLDEYDRAIKNPLLDQEQVTRDFLLAAYHKSKKDPDKYFNKAANSSPFAAMANSAAKQTQTTPAGAPPPQPGQKPGGLPNTPSTGQLGQ
jgi:hypothetical protein